jgi:hypothetical protein
LAVRFSSLAIPLGVCLLLHAGFSSPGWSQQEAKEQSPIQDNSFLIEEAYNQERGVVQHISTFTRMWNSRDWSYTFTQEWPEPHNWRHQLSYTLIGAHAGGFAGSGMGWGDTVLNYRYQLVGDGDARFGFAPRVSVLLPTGDVTRGRSSGGAGIQTNLPASVVLHRRLVSHWNAGATLVPHAQSADHERAATVGYTLGQSLVFLLNPRVNLLLETVDNRFQCVTGPARTEWSRTTYVSPGVRWAYNFKSGLQIVPGVAMPVGIGASAGERGIFLYLSFEHPYRAAR